MADLPQPGLIERDVEQAIIALKKGAYLLKYGRRGKPKFCPFRISNDELFLTWYSGKNEKQLKISSISRIVPGQRTATFLRYPRPEKEYQSFSLLTKEASLDLICKDKEEAEIWFTGLQALITGFPMRKQCKDVKDDGTTSSDANSPVSHIWRNSPLTSPFGSCENLNLEVADPYDRNSPYGSPTHLGMGMKNRVLGGKLPPIWSSGLASDTRSMEGFENINPQLHMGPAEAFRVSLSSCVSSSSQGSWRDDVDSSSLHDVYMWGEGIGEGVLGGGIVKSGESSRADTLVPKALESAAALDVRSVACGGRHAAIVTRQGEVFTWGEESGGRLGQRIDGGDVSFPKLVDSLVTGVSVELAACGEYHTCAVTLAGELYTWGDGTHKFGLLGHSNGMSSWTPKRVNGPIEGLHIADVSCGPWHTALLTSAGRLFTFGDGTFGVLGHGDTKSSLVPREVDSLKGLRVARVSCGAWHMAAIVEVMVGSANKLFTWGDGDKGQLGHGGGDQKLVPTCVAAVIDHNFRQVACGHSLTVALTSDGHVFAMGSAVSGGGPRGVPYRVDGKLSNAFVDDIACGAFHTVALTANSEVYTWGKGANGRLGHGDTDDRATPTLVEALRGKQVKRIACGTNYTAAICLHTWVSGADQTTCSGCGMAFGLTRKRHNCYNCGLVLCHACTSKKVLKASLSPSPNKPYRVCDPCYFKLSESLKPLMPRDGRQMGLFRQSSSAEANGKRTGKAEPTTLKPQNPLLKLSGLDQLKMNDGKSPRRKSGKMESSSGQVSPVRSEASQKSYFGRSKKMVSASVPQSRMISRASSPILSRKSSPPHPMSPMYSNDIDVSLWNSNDVLNQEVLRLKNQVEILSRRCQLQNVELGRSTNQLQETMAKAREENTKRKVAKEVIRSLTTQLKSMSDKLPGGRQRINARVEEQRRPPSRLGLNSSKTSSNSNTITAAAAATTTSATTIATERSGNCQNKDGVRGTQANGNNNNEAMMKLSEAEPGLEWVEQDQPGVYITFSSSTGGKRELKRIRFSRKRFNEKQAEVWWHENKPRVYEKYNVHIEKSSKEKFSLLN